MNNQVFLYNIKKNVFKDTKGFHLYPISNEIPIWKNIATEERSAKEHQ